LKTTEPSYQEEAAWGMQQQLWFELVYKVPFVWRTNIPLKIFNDIHAEENANKP
jgi:hypothetical protein